MDSRVKGRIGYLLQEDKLHFSGMYVRDRKYLIQECLPVLDILLSARKESYLKLASVSSHINVRCVELRVTMNEHIEVGVIWSAKEGAAFSVISKHTMKDHKYAIVVAKLKKALLDNIT